MMNQMMQEMDAEEREIFDMDMSYIHWQMFMGIYMHGLKRYVIEGEKDDTIIGANMYNHLVWPTRENRISAME